MALTVARLTRRSITPEDVPLLERIYATTRAQEMAMVPWTAEQKTAFVHMQIEAQHRHYLTFYPYGRYELLFDGNDPGGRLYVDRRVDEVCVMDITLQPEYRGQGLGTALMREVVDAAFADGLPVGLHVEGFNPARRLYERLGFVDVGEEGIYHKMRA